MSTRELFAVLILLIFAGLFLALFNLQHVLILVFVSVTVLYFGLLGFRLLPTAILFLVMLTLAITFIGQDYVNLTGTAVVGSDAQYSELQSVPADFKSIEISPSSGDLASFEVNSRVVYRENAALMTWDERSHNLGLLLAEVYLPIPRNTIVLNANGVYQTVAQCLGIGACPRISISVLDMPLGAFFSSEHAHDLEHLPYIDEEAIWWTQSPVDYVRFAFVRPPFNLARGLIDPILTVFSASTFVTQAMSAALGAIGAMILLRLWKRIKKSWLLLHRNASS